MKRRSFGPMSHEIAVLGQGTWNLEKGERKEAIAALRRGLDLGMNHIDTAEMYGSGVSETIIGEAIAGRRGEVFLVSKVLPQNASPAGTRKACESSLARLKTDRLDCYLLHWRGRHPLEGTIAAFEELRREGKILSWGVSNFDVADLEEAWNAPGGDHLACNQVLYHLEERAIEHEILPWCEQRNIAVVGYSPFGSNRFPSPSSAGGRVLASIGDTHRTTPRQVALAFLTRSPSPFAIPKSGNVKHTEENAAAGALTLSKGEIDRIDGAFRLGPRRRSLPTI